MDTRELETLSWPPSRLGEAMAALVVRAGVVTSAPDPLNPPPSISDAEIPAWMERHAKLLGCEAEPIETTFADLDQELLTAYPALLCVSDSVYLAVLDARAGALRVLTPLLRLERVPLAGVCDLIREPLAGPSRCEMERLLDDARLPHVNESKTIRLLVREQLREMRFNQCWILRSLPGAHPVQWLREPHAIRNLSRLIAAHSVQYLLWIASWAILGRLSFEGRMDRGWLLAWALLLLTLVPFRLLTTFLQGALAIGVGGILKRRLLCGAMRLEPEEMRHQGIGSFLGQVFEAEAVETLALSGGVAGLLAAIELVVSGFVLGRLAILLLVWCSVTGVLAWRFLRRYQRWTGTRMQMTQELIEAMVGQRTRLAQQPRQHWHDAEDGMLSSYVAMSGSMDGSAGYLLAAVPRGWLLMGLGGLTPGIVAGRSSPVEIAITLGGVLLAFGAFKRLTASFVDVAGAWVAWQRINPLFHAAARPERLGELLVSHSAEDGSEKVIDADRLTFRYRGTGSPALQACSLAIRRGERILLEGPSGGGKSTFASLLAGMRDPQSGLLLVNGLDRHVLGDKRWRQQVAAAPQFHENHILTETLAFNLLMGRSWPPTQTDISDADSLCRDLGLGELLDRMPSGLQQMVGEGGWQLSHGERSRIYIARALLQTADLVILDESFAALDPETLRIALECTLQHAKTLMVIAHP